MANAASAGQLRTAFEEHLEQTENHVQRLERIFEALDEKATGKKCAAMNGLVKEGNEVIGDTDDTAVRDAGLIAAAQKVEHYEISGYGSARTHAEVLGYDKAVRLLDETLSEERAADKRLNDLALNLINEQAAGGRGDAGTVRPKTRTAGGSGHAER